MTPTSAHFYPKRVKRSDGTSYLQSYVAEFYDPHRRPLRKRVSLKTKDQATAARRFTDLERRFDRGEWDPWTDRAPDENLTFDEAAERFLADRRERGLAAKSVSLYGGVLSSLGKHLPPGYPLFGLTEKDVEAWLATGKRSDATKLSYRDRVRIFCGWCVGERLLKVNPLPKRKPVGKAARTKSLPRFLSEGEEARLVRTVEAEALLQPGIGGGNRWLLDLVRFALGTGLRRGELLNLRWGDLDLLAGSVHVRNRDGFTTKSGQERVVPLAGAALAVVRELAGARVGEDPSAHVFTGVGGGPVNPDYLSKRFSHYRRLAGLPGQLHFHSLRHTYASRLVQSGASVYKVQALLGHSNVKTTQQYAHLTGQSLRSDVDRAFGETSTEETRLRAEVARLREEVRGLRERPAEGGPSLCTLGTQWVHGAAPPVLCCPNAWSLS